MMTTAKCVAVEHRNWPLGLYYLHLKIAVLRPYVPGKMYHTFYNVRENDWVTQPTEL